MRDSTTCTMMKILCYPSTQLLHSTQFDICREPGPAQHYKEVWSGWVATCSADHWYARYQHRRHAPDKPDKKCNSNRYSEKKRMYKLECNYLNVGQETKNVAQRLRVRSSGPHPVLGESSTFRRGVRVSSSETG